MKNNRTRWIVFFLMVACSVAIFLWHGGFPQGLDIKGGTRFVLAIDEAALDANIRQRISQRSDTNDNDTAYNEAVIEEAKREASKQILTVIRNRIDQQGTKEPNIYEQTSGGDRRIVVELPGITDKELPQVRGLLVKQAKLEFKAVVVGNEEMVKPIMDGSAPPPIGYKLAALKGDDGNTRNYLVRWSKEDWLDSTNALERVGADRAEFEKDKEQWDARRQSFTDPSLMSAWHAAVTNHEPAANGVLMLEKEIVENRNAYQPAYIENLSRMSGEVVNSARVGNQMGKIEVLLGFDSVGREQFCEVTELLEPNGGENEGNPIGRRLGIILDGTLYSSPTINEKICGGSASISGSFDSTEATALALVLRSGSLAAPLKIDRESTISASLGKEVIEAGTFALIVGGILVLVFMLIYYRIAGGVANLALIADVLLLPLGMFVAGGFLSIFSHQPGNTLTGLPVLTLPGLAGLVLTIGMAVDANVLIFERMREEQRAGKRFANAVTGGFDKAFSTIFDANLTTMIVAIILYIFGSGPIRGFAVTLTAGILVSVYTALVFTRLIFDWLARNKERQSIKMMTLVKDTDIDFLGKRNIAAVISVVVILLVTVLFGMRGKDNFGIDFTGGRHTGMIAEQGELPDVADVRQVLVDKNLDRGATVVINAGDDGEMLDIRVRASDETTNLVKHVKAAFPDTEFRVPSDDDIGASLGMDLARSGAISMCIALLAIVIYISLRFEFAFAIGAIVALVHDVLITIGVYCLIPGQELSGPSIAALLTVVGYSVNDTIVVFDRIREDWSLNKQGDRSDIANKAINQTLSRTLLTSGTTLLAVLAMLILGKGVVRDFAMILTIGIFIGTYSSVFVATPVMLWVRGRAAAKAGAPGATAKASA